MPSARSAAIAEQLDCQRAPGLGCVDPGKCWDLGHCGMSRDESRHVVLEKPPPKRTKRIVDAGAVKRKMRTETKCRCGCGRPATDGHHILPKSLGGDDVEDNIAGVAHWCHMAFEFSAVDREDVGKAIGANLRDREIEYVLTKLAGREILKVVELPDVNEIATLNEDPGWEFLHRYYGVERRPIERSTT